MQTQDKRVLLGTAGLVWPWRPPPPRHLPCGSSVAPGDMNKKNPGFELRSCPMKVSLTLNGGQPGVAGRPPATPQLVCSLHGLGKLPPR